MPRQSDRVLGTEKELSGAKSETDRTDFRIRGALGLQLRVTAKGGKAWAFAYKSPATGKWAKIALGRYPEIGLKEAKGLAIERAEAVRKGADPIHDRRKVELAETFAELAARYMLEHAIRNARGDRHSRSTDEAQRLLNHDILPVLGRLMAEAVVRQHVMRVVEAIADRGAYVAADRALGLIRAIYNWACGTGRLDRNPTIGLKKRNTVRPKTRVLSAKELQVLWHALDGPGMTPALSDALRLQLATGTRISEVVGAARAEFDLERATWTLPAIRTKSEREHVVPLSPIALAVVQACIARADAEGRRRVDYGGVPFVPSPWMFPSPGPRSKRRVASPAETARGSIDPHAATRAIVRNRGRLAAAGISAPFNTHDLRRTAATQLGEMGVADELIERILNHAPRTVAGRHYNHARYLEPMRKALDAWGERLVAIVEGREPASNVVSLRSGGEGM